MFLKKKYPCIRQHDQSDCVAAFAIDIAIMESGSYEIDNDYLDILDVKPQLFTVYGKKVELFNRLGIVLHFGHCDYFIPFALKKLKHKCLSDKQRDIAYIAKIGAIMGGSVGTAVAIVGTGAAVWLLGTTRMFY